MLKTFFLLLSAGKLGKVLTTGGTMLLSVFAYTLVFGWRYAVGLVGLIFCHEMGHYLAARQRGLDVGAPTFIPFVGAWIQLNDLPHDVETEAYVAFAGPVVGSGAALACYALGRAESSHLLLALAYAGFMLNLFNLLPLSPLDGGRITAIISPRMWWMGVPVLGGLFVWHPSPMFVLVALLALPHLASTFRAAKEPRPGYYDTPLRTRVEYALCYLGLAGFLGAMTYELYRMLRHA